MALDRLAAEPTLLKLCYLPLVSTLALTLAFLVRYLLRLLWSTPRHVPGPFLARASRLWYLFQVLRGDWHQVILQQHRRNGELMAGI
jgi:hypothetical protein